MIPVRVMDALKGEATALAIYARLRCYDNSSVGCAWPSQQRLAADLDLGVQVVMRHMKVLVSKGLVTVEKSSMSGHRRATNRYRFTDLPPITHNTLTAVQPITGDTSSSQPPITGDTSPPITSNTQPPITGNGLSILTNLDLVELEEELFIIDEPMTEPVADNGFDTFWVNYPRKVGKGQAKKAYEKALKVASRDLILAGAKRLTDDPNLPELTYVKHASTWLAAESWTDEPFPARHVTNDKQQGIDARSAHAKKLMTGEAEYTWL